MTSSIFIGLQLSQETTCRKNKTTRILISHLSQSQPLSSSLLLLLIPGWRLIPGKESLTVTLTSIKHLYYTCMILLILK